MLNKIAGLPPDVEIKVKGRVLVTVHGQELNVDGVDLHTDLMNITRIVKILADILDTSIGQMGGDDGAKSV